MCTTIRDIVCKSYKEKFLDCFDRGNNILITSYNYLDREIVIDEDNNTCELGEKKNRCQVKSIAELRNAFTQLISAVVEMFCTTSLNNGDMPSCYYDFSINDAESELIEKQLVFDILFDQYMKKSEKITLWEYALDMSNRLYSDDSYADSIRKKLKRSMEQYYDIIKYSLVGEELEEFAVNPQLYEKYFTPKLKDNIAKKKLKIVWDFFYYNHNMITYRQFRRQPMRDSNTSYETLLKDLNEYDDFVKKILPVDNESVNKYFKKIMEYYYLESYKRIDFMLILANPMSKIDIPVSDRNNIFLKRFCPKVLYPFDYKGRLGFDIKYNYYRPLLMIEQELFRQIRAGKDVDIHKYGIQLQKYQIIRAKAYEIFKYHAEYVLPDYKGEENYNTYKEIKNFIQQYYNLKSYHDTNEVWEIIKSSDWKHMDEGTKLRAKNIIRNFNSINEALFWKSPNREIN